MESLWSTVIGVRTEGLKDICLDYFMRIIEMMTVTANPFIVQLFDSKFGRNEYESHFMKLHSRQVLDFGENFDFRWLLYLYYKICSLSDETNYLQLQYVSKYYKIEMRYSSRIFSLAIVRCSDCMYIPPERLSLMGFNCFKAMMHRVNMEKESIVETPAGMRSLTVDIKVNILSRFRNVGSNELQITGRRLSVETDHGRQ